jgi:hypothetical protein
MANIQPFHFEVFDKKLKDIRQRVAEYLWHEMPDDGGWDYGTNLDYMKVFFDYWLNHYDWRKHEAKTNRFSHFKVRVDGINLHYVHEKGSGSSPQPLII